MRRVKISPFGKSHLLTPRNIWRGIRKTERLSESNVLFYLEQMKKGQWHLTGDTIKFAN